MANKKKSLININDNENKEIKKVRKVNKKNKESKITKKEEIKIKKNNDIIIKKEKKSKKQKIKNTNQDKTAINKENKNKDPNKNQKEFKRNDTKQEEIRKTKKIKPTKVKPIKDIEVLPLKKKKKNQELKKKVIIILIIISLIFVFLISTIILLIIVKDDNKGKENIPSQVINYNEYYYDNVNITNDKKLYELVDGSFREIGIVYKDLSINLEKDEYLDKGYFKIKDLNYYIDYKDITLNEVLEELKKETYKNYIPFNENIKTIKETKLYLNNNLIYSLNEGIELPILIKEDEYYGVIFKDKLFYVKKDECEVVSSNNTEELTAEGIATLVYHFTYDSTNKEEERNCKNSNITICLSDTLFKEHLTYMKENNFYTLTMNDLDLFIDGKIRLPKKSVLITIDDGYFVSAAIKVLEELDLQATLFLIGTAGSPDNYKSDNLEIHSHTYNMHYPGACSGGQGSPLKCLNRGLLLEDLRKSREQLNGSDVFCYPFFEYNDYAISVLKEAGFKMAFIGGRRKIKVGTDKYKLPRYGIINTTTVNDIKKIIN